MDVYSRFHGSGMRHEKKTSFAGYVENKLPQKNGSVLSHGGTPKSSHGRLGTMALKPKNDHLWGSPMPILRRKLINHKVWRHSI
jgi:hypothetical protein